MTSIIKWKTGVPPERGSYLVTFRYIYDESIFNAKATLSHYATGIGRTYWDGELWSNYDCGSDECKVIAWCKIKDIIPFAEHTKQTARQDMNFLDLRIGNLVSYEDQNFIISSINPPYVELMGTNNDRLFLTDINSEKLKPIHISENSLKKAGFSKNLYYYKRIDEHTFLEFYMHEWRFRKYWQGVDEYNNHTKVREIPFQCQCHYIHELQNAYYLSTKKELSINL